MSASVFFSNLRKRVVERIDRSTKEIIICTPYFTSKEIYSIMLNKAAAGVRARIILRASAINTTLPLGQLAKAGVILRLIKEDSFSHSGESFFLIDRKQLLTGNYQLTDQSEYAGFHSIVEMDSENVIKQYLARFRQVLDTSVQFEQKLLVGENDIKQREEKAAHVEQALEEELYRTLTMFKVNNLPIQSDDIMQDIDIFGAVGTLRRHIMRDDDELFTPLVEHGFVNRTFESMVAMDTYNPLFAPEVIKKAKNRVS